MKEFETPRIKISEFSREEVLTASVKSAWEQAMAEAGNISGTKGTVSVKLNKVGSRFGEQQNKIRQPQNSFEF